MGAEAGAIEQIFDAIKGGWCILLPSQPGNCADCRAGHGMLVEPISHTKNIE